MHERRGLALLLCLLACAGCGPRKSTAELIADLKSGKEREGVIAAPPCRVATRKRSFRR